jgi:hypothetical protein
MLGADEQRQGFLPGADTPFSFSPQAGGLPNLRHDFYGTQSQGFFDGAYELLQALETPFRSQPLNDSTAAYSDIVSQARSLVYNDPVGRVFQFTAADEARYGGNDLGRALIVARNAVQARMGAVFINITYPGWDQHFRQFDMGNGTNLYILNSNLDRAVGNLIADLRISGHLRSTLIVALGEFGRTPGPLNQRDGRDHYRPVMSALLAGGGIRGGQAIGVTDATGAEIIDPGWSRQRPIYMEDIASTIYSALGIDWTKVIHGDALGRGFEYVPSTDPYQYQPINELW